MSLGVEPEESLFGLGDPEPTEEVLDLRLGPVGCTTASSRSVSMVGRSSETGAGGGSRRRRGGACCSRWLCPRSDGTGCNPPSAFFASPVDEGPATTDDVEPEGCASGSLNSTPSGRGDGGVT